MGRFESSIRRAWVAILVQSQGPLANCPGNARSVPLRLSPSRRDALSPSVIGTLKAWYGSLTLYLLFVAVMPRCVHMASDRVDTLLRPGCGCSRKKRSISCVASGPRGSV